MIILGGEAPTKADWVSLHMRSPSHEEEQVGTERRTAGCCWAIHLTRNWGPLPNCAFFPNNSKSRRQRHNKQAHMTAPDRPTPSQGEDLIHSASCLWAAARLEQHDVWHLGLAASWIG